MHPQATAQLWASDHRPGAECWPEDRLLRWTPSSMPHQMLFARRLGLARASSCKAVRAAMKTIRATEWGIPRLCCLVLCGACLTTGPGSGPSCRQCKRRHRLFARSNDRQLLGSGRHGDLAKPKARLAETNFNRPCWNRGAPDLSLLAISKRSRSSLRSV